MDDISFLPFYVSKHYAIYTGWRSNSTHTTQRYGVVKVEHKMNVFKYHSANSQKMSRETLLCIWNGFGFSGSETAYFLFTRV